MKKKINVAVIFGGKSGEHEVSLQSAASVMSAMDKEKYNIIPIGITKDGKWMRYSGSLEKIESGEWINIAEELLNTDPNTYTFSMIGTSPDMHEKIDVIFPVLHGPFGEDGTIQGIFEIANIPYVGAGVLSSSLGMDKVYAKKIFQQAGLPVGNYMVVMRKQFEENKALYIKLIQEKLGYPVFVKPANLGSSVGISKARNAEELMAGLEEAAKYDRKLLIEQFIDCREIECAILGNDEPQASVVGEILPSQEFYDYRAKYLDNGKSKMCIPADIPEEKSQEIRKMALQVYQVLDCMGLARVDFFLEKETMKVYVNEINTMPGFTKYSMYPLLWEATGVPYSKLIDQLIELAIKKYQENQKR